MHLFKKKALSMNDRLSVWLWVQLLHLLALQLVCVPLSLFWKANNKKKKKDSLGKWSRGANCSHTSPSPRTSLLVFANSTDLLACLLQVSTLTAGNRNWSTHDSWIWCYPVTDKLLQRGKDRPQLCYRAGFRAILLRSPLPSPLLWPAVACVCV